MGRFEHFHEKRFGSGTSESNATEIALANLQELDLLVLQLFARWYVPQVLGEVMSERARLAREAATSFLSFTWASSLSLTCTCCGSIKSSCLAMLAHA